MTAIPPANRIQQEKKSDLNTKLPNHYFNPKHEIPNSTKIYINLRKRSNGILKIPNNYQK